MLLPRRFKYRKQQRGSRAGMSKGHQTVQFGEYGLKALENGWITNRQIEAARSAETRARPRRGRDRAPRAGCLAVPNPGRGLLELAGVPEPLAREAIRLAAR